MHFMRIRKRVYVLLSAAVLLSGCASQGNISEVLQNEQSESGTDIQAQDAQRAENEDGQSASDNGYIHYGNVYQESGITLGDELLYAADWENTTAEIICTDPACLHEPYDESSNRNPECSAAVTGNWNVDIFLHSFLYEGRRIILSCSGEEGDTEGEINYITDIYSCEPDGTDRRKVASIDGAISSFAGLVYDGYLYGTVSKKYIQTEVGQKMEDGTVVHVMETSSEDVLCSLNLDTWELTEFETKAGDKPFSYWPAIFYMDDSVYCAASDEDVYRIDVRTQTGECLPDVYRNTEAGADGRLLYPRSTGDAYQIMAYDVDTGEEECFVASQYESYPSIFAMGDLILTECGSETEEGWSVLCTIYDPEGNVRGEFTYDQSLFPIYPVGEHIVFPILSEGGCCITKEQLIGAGSTGELEDMKDISIQAP